MLLISKELYRVDDSFKRGVQLAKLESILAKSVIIKLGEI